MTREENLEQFFVNERTIILPLDHGVAIPVPGLEDPLELIEKLNPYVNGYVMNLGLALRATEAVAERGICLRTDVYNTRLQGEGAGSISVYGCDTAEAVGAHAVMNMLFPGSEQEATVTQNCADLVTESIDIDIPVILESLPVGLGQSAHYTVDKVRHAVRLAAELGADVVKTVYPVNATVDDFRSIVAESYVPVVVLGGAAMNDDASLFKMVADAMAAGAAGIAIGRNVWQHRHPLAVARSLHAIVHDEADAMQALALMKEAL
jgi:DhnA family fructose-bisphosphate aldolase class Ia